MLMETAFGTLLAAAAAAGDQFLYLQNLDWQQWKQMAAQGARQ
jgi:hypothetical protein